MFYFAEIAAIAVCWLFYCELYWKTERKVLDECSRKYLGKRCRTFREHLFFTPVSGKAKLGMLYYLNKCTFLFLLVFTLFHFALGWNESLTQFIRIITTLTVVILGFFAVFNSPASTRFLCINKNITSGKTVVLLQITSFLSELILLLIYLYFAWVYIAV